MRGGVPGTRISLCGGSEVCAAAGLGVGGSGKSVGAAGKRLRESFTRSARVLASSSSTKTKALAILIVKHPWTPTAGVRVPGTQGWLGSPAGGGDTREEAISCACKEPGGGGQLCLAGGCGDASCRKVTGAGLRDGQRAPW